MTTTRRTLTALFTLAALAAFLVIGTVPNSHAATAAWQAPRCQEDQVIARGGRCLDHDDATTKFKRVSEAGWGYWYDTRRPGALKRPAVVPACHRWQMVTRWGGCVGLGKADFRGGWWYRA